jgi:hypothetical protein
LELINVNKALNRLPLHNCEALSATSLVGSCNGHEASGQETPQAPRAEGYGPARQPLRAGRHLACQQSLEKAHLRKVAQRQATLDRQVLDYASSVRRVVVTLSTPPRRQRSIKYHQDRAMASTQQRSLMLESKPTCTPCPPQDIREGMGSLEGDRVLDHSTGLDSQEP